jgi:hypothetical protein
MTLFRTKRKVFLFILFSILIILACFLGWRLWKARNSDQAAGIYITAGGQSYLVIKSGFWGLRVQEGYFITTGMDLFSPQNLTGTALSADFCNGQLSLTQKETYEMKGSIWDFSKRENPEVDTFFLSLDLKPSQSIPGDLDLQRAELVVSSHSASNVLSRDYWKNLVGSNSWRHFRENLVDPIGTEEIMRYIHDPKDEPLYSMARRVDDPRVIEYFRLRTNGVITKETLALARSLASEHPGDPYLELHRIEMEALVGSPEEAEKLWYEWHKAHSAYPDLLLGKMGRRVLQTLYFEKTKKKTLQIMQPDTVSTSRQLDLSGRLDWLKKFLSSDQIFFSSYPLVPPLKSSSYLPSGVPDFLSIQVSAKVARTMATLYLFQGHREESLEILAASYRLGQALNSKGSLIQRLIGIAVRAIACAGLQIYALNACESEADFQTFRAMLERLHNTPAQEDGRHILDDERSPFLSLLKPVSGIGVPNYLEAQTRHRVTDMKFQLLRMATAAKYRLITTGDFPSSEKEFAPFLPDGIPLDVFVKNAPLHFLRRSPEEFIVYSFGPNNVDETAAFSYDPTNGTITPGDIFITIPRKREFPFPKQGVHAANAYSLLEQFPNGLPVDVFADTRGLPLSIIESTDTHPVVIFSFGPNTDENEGYYPSGLNPFPGEGLIQPMAPPGSAPTPVPSPVPPVPTPTPGLHPTYGRTLQKVFRRSETKPMLLGSWTLQPLYDPTNGTVSPGDLFVEIPR